MTSITDINTLTEEQKKRRDELALDHFMSFQTKDEEAQIKGHVVIEKRYGSFCYGYDAGYADGKAHEQSETHDINCPYCTKPFWFSGSVDRRRDAWVVRGKEPLPPTYKELENKLKDLDNVLSRVNQTNIGEFIIYHPVIQPDEKTMVDLYVNMESKITELTRKLNVAKKIAKEAIQRIDCLPTCRTNSDSWLVKCTCGADKKSKELREALKELE